MALLHEEDDHNHKDKRRNSAEDRYLSKPEKAKPTGEFVIQWRSQKILIGEADHWNSF